MKSPQNWNRYTYALSNPMLYTDPTGEVVDLSRVSAEEREVLLASLQKLTGNTYGVNDKGELVVVAYGDTKSATASLFLDEMIGADTSYTVVSKSGDDGFYFGARVAGRNEIWLDFADFGKIAYGQIAELAFSPATTFLHEAGHLFGLKDPEGKERQAKEIGQVEEFVNGIRQERGLPIRAESYSHKDFGSKYGLAFRGVDPKNPSATHYIYYPKR